MAKSILNLVNIKKDYALKDQEPVHALKGISLQFRHSEFVAILGHSGCGKTTLLNITGGLDHYDDGDLIIKGKSTKDFKDGDWDTYRNHSIGFVFQTYNLIPHQNILSNVELALTISGISKEERVKRAKDALDKVGLAGLYKKKPNQLSGGQMQRVAIARALVNSPEIVLADEPTGALDSETSVQIMEILKEVANDRLVIMVTHNPELAERYANRIVRMKDGEIVSDSHPFTGDKEEVEHLPEEVKKGKKHSSMSFFTAFSLSVGNLWSKMRRTVLVALAGSIGIIGVSSILGMSCGVNNYIGDMENDLLSSYPLGIAEESMDMTSLLTGLSNEDGEKIAEFDTTTQVGVDSMLSFLISKYTDFTNIKTNDITSNLINYISEMPESYYSAISYDYGIDPTNNLFTSFKKSDNLDPVNISMNGLTQSYIETLMTVDGFSEYANYVDIFTGFMKEMPNEEEYILSQYDLLGNSTFATKEDEMMIVVDEKTTLTDILLAQIGLYPQDQFIAISTKAIAINEADKKYKEGTYTRSEYEQELARIESDEKYYYESRFEMEDILNHEMYYYPHQDIYSKTPNPNVYVSHNNVDVSLSGDFEYNEKTYTLILGLSYLPGNDAMSGHLILLKTDGSGSEIEMNQAILLYRDLSYPVDKGEDRSVADGKWSISALGTTLELIIDTSNKETSLDEKEIDFTATGSLKTSMLPNQTISLSSGKVHEEIPDTPDFFCDAYINSNWKNGKKMKITGILRAKSNINFGTLTRGLYYTKAFADMYMNDALNSEIVQEYRDFVKEKRFQNSGFNAYTIFRYDDYKLDPEHPTEKWAYTNALNGDMTESLSAIFLSFLSSSTSRLDDEKVHLRALSGLKICSKDDENNPGYLAASYWTELLPEKISIYPKGFSEKENVIHYLDDWNVEKDLVIKGETVTYEDRTDITYTDTISMIVSVISTLVTTISIALISFTSLSLVVSCFMIAVITYISVMERVKEIGVIRSLGGRKKDVSRLFTAENLITGFASGAIGIGVTYILQIIVNAIVSPFGVQNIFALPFTYALIMIGIATLLSVISGAIPSMSASKQDPVIALRTE